MATFGTFVGQCAQHVAADLLVAIASVESGLEPLAVRDRAIVIISKSAGEAANEAARRMDAGRDVGLGLFALSVAQIRSVDRAVIDVFEPCAAIQMADRLLAQAAAAARGPSIGEAALERYALRSLWKPDGRFRSAEDYVAAVMAARAGAPDRLRTEIGGTLPSGSRPTAASTTQPISRAQPTTHGLKPSDSQPPAPCWDAFARARAGGACAPQTVPSNELVTFGR